MKIAWTYGGGNGYANSGACGENGDVFQAVVLQDALPFSEIPVQSKKEVKWSIFPIFRFITGPTELGDVPTPRTPPKIFVNTDSEQEELILVVYKVL